MLGEVTVVGTVDDLQSLDFYAPNSSAVLKRQDIEEQGARKLDQVLHYQAGILSEPYGADNKVEWFKIRGFDASISLDGTPTTPNGYFVWKPEIFGVESVEVLKGPNSLVFGASETGGVVNLVTKRPHKKETLLLNAEVGNRDRLGLSADYNGIANSDGTVYYRIVTQVRREDGMQRRTDMKSHYLAPSVTFDFSDRTSLTLLSSIQHEEGRPTNGFLSAYGTIINTPYGRIKRRTHVGEPDFDRLRRTQISAGWLFSHKFARDWTFTQNYKFSRLNLDQRNVFAWSSDGNRELLRGYTLTEGDTRTHYIDNRVSGSLRLGAAVELLPTIGFDYLKSDTSGQNNGFGWVPNLDMFAPVHGAPFAVDATPYKLHPRQRGLYGAVQLRVGGNWILNAGIRHDRARSDGIISGVDSSYDVSHDSVNAGVMYISDHGISPYVSYSESFKPLVGVDGYGNTYRPYEGQQTEVGIKLEPSWLDGALTLAYFDVEEKNALISDSSNIQTQGGKRTNKGVELRGDFKVRPNTAVRVSYTHNHSRQDITPSQTVRTPLIPKHQASLWVSHRFNLHDSNDLTVAAGARYNGSTEDERYYPGERISSHTLLDLMMRYEIDRDWALQLNARNLTDKTYVSGCDFYCYYGGGRTVDLQLQYRWQ
ncbi:MAG: TonB-dependent siderophore receptor [Azoarcus sp.]|jgi:iron complex outermembrane receptor protein|nr:TonB-dependent siderophore receptor [Azoarcus sp.]